MKARFPKDVMMESFEDILNQYEPMIHKIIHTLKIYQNKDDYFQIGVISLWEAWKQFNPEKGKFLNFAYTSVKGRILNELTKNNSREERTQFAKDEYWALIEDQNTLDPLEFDTILGFCQPLTDKQKRWVFYTVFNGMSITDIAKQEGVSPSAVKLWRKGATEKLRQILSN